MNPQAIVFYEIDDHLLEKLSTYEIKDSTFCIKKINLGDMSFSEYEEMLTQVIKLKGINTIAFASSIDSQAILMFSRIFTNGDLPVRNLLLDKLNKEPLQKLVMILQQEKCIIREVTINEIDADAITELKPATAPKHSSALTLYNLNLDAIKSLVTVLTDKYCLFNSLAITSFMPINSLRSLNAAISSPDLKISLLSLHYLTGDHIKIMTSALKQISVEQFTLGLTNLFPGTEETLSPLFTPFTKLHSVLLYKCNMATIQKITAILDDPLNELKQLYLADLSIEQLKIIGEALSRSTCKLEKLSCARLNKDAWQFLFQNHILDRYFEKDEIEAMHSILSSSSFVSSNTVVLFDINQKDKFLNMTFPTSRKHFNKNEQTLQKYTNICSNQYKEALLGFIAREEVIKQIAQTTTVDHARNAIVARRISEFKQYLESLKQAAQPAHGGSKTYFEARYSRFYLGLLFANCRYTYKAYIAPSNTTVLFSSDDVSEKKRIEIALRHYVNAIQIDLNKSLEIDLESTLRHYKLTVDIIMSLNSYAIKLSEEPYTRDCLKNIADDFQDALRSRLLRVLSFERDHPGLGHSITDYLNNNSRTIYSLLDINTNEYIAAKANNIQK